VFCEKLTPLGALPSLQDYVALRKPLRHRHGNRPALFQLGHSDRHPQLAKRPPLDSKRLFCFQRGPSSGRFRGRVWGFRQLQRISNPPRPARGGLTPSQRAVGIIWVVALWRDVPSGAQAKGNGGGPGPAAAGTQRYVAGWLPRPPAVPFGFEVLQITRPRLPTSPR